MLFRLIRSPIVGKAPSGLSTVVFTSTKIHLGLCTRMFSADSKIASVEMKPSDTIIIDDPNPGRFQRVGQDGRTRPVLKNSKEYETMLEELEKTRLAREQAQAELDADELSPMKFKMLVNRMKPIINTMVQEACQAAAKEEMQKVFNSETKKRKHKNNSTSRKTLNEIDHLNQMKKAAKHIEKTLSSLKQSGMNTSDNPEELEEAAWDLDSKIDNAIRLKVEKGDLIDRRGLSKIATENLVDKEDLMNNPAKFGVVPLNQLEDYVTQVNRDRIKEGELVDRLALILNPAYFGLVDPLKLRKEIANILARRIAVPGPETQQASKISEENGNLAVGENGEYERIGRSAQEVHDLSKEMTRLEGEIQEALSRGTRFDNNNKSNIEQRKREMNKFQVAESEARVALADKAEQEMQLMNMSINGNDSDEMSEHKLSEVEKTRIALADQAGQGMQQLNPSAPQN